MTCEIGIRAHDFPIFDDTGELAKKISEYGLSNIQYSPKFSLKQETDNGFNMSFGLAHHSETIFAKDNINVAILGCYINMIHPDLKERQKNMDLFERYLALAKSFHCPLVATETGSINNIFKPQQDNWTEKTFQTTIRQIRKMVEQAEKLGVLIGIEPGVNHPIYDIKSIVRMIREINSPNLKIIFDPTNLILHPTDSQIKIVKEGIQQFGNIIYAFHIKDYAFINGQKEIVPLGEGLSPLKDISQIIQSHIPHAYVFMEETPQEKFDQSIKNFKELFA